MYQGMALDTFREWCFRTNGEESPELVERGESRFSKALARTVIARQLVPRSV
jgi:hypothetical protein